jgi:hypothetical protein
MSERGVAVWSSAAWRAGAVAWIDERLAAAGLERAGEVEQPRVRPWATLLRAPLRGGGAAWLKAAGPGTAFEVPLYGLLARVVPGRVLAPIAADAERGWILLPDGGPSLDGVDGLAAALADYGRLQRELELHVEAMLALGVPDMRPAAMVGRFGEALEAADGGDPETLRRIAAMAPMVEGWCERLAASPLPPSLDHNDLHPRNVLVDDAGGTRYYDWGDSVIAHPFAATLVPLGMMRGALGERALLRARDAYLDVFSDRAPRAELRETLELACQVAKIARALTWHRALQAVRDQGEAVDAAWAEAPLASLAMVLDEDYLGR